MSELSANQLWTKLSFLLTHVAFAGILFAFDIPGWGIWTSQCYDKGLYKGSCEAVAFMMVVGYLCLLTAVVLIECIALLDEVRSNKGAKIAFIVFAFVSGLMIFIGNAVFISKLDDHPISDTDTMLSSFMIIGAGVFVLLDLLGVNGPR